MSMWWHPKMSGVKYDKTVEYYDEKNIADMLIGHKVIDVENGDTLVLDNGTKLLVEPNDGCCCGAGCYYIEHIASCNNAITNVEFDCIDDHKINNRWSDYLHYKIFVIADGIRTELLDVYGTDGNGYYGTGYSIDVYIPEQD